MKGLNEHQGGGGRWGWRRSSHVMIHNSATPSSSGYSTSLFWRRISSQFLVGLSGSQLINEILSGDYIRGLALPLTKSSPHVPEIPGSTLLAFLRLQSQPILQGCELGFF